MRPSVHARSEVGFVAWILGRRGGVVLFRLGDEALSEATPMKSMMRMHPLAGASLILIGSACVAARGDFMIGDTVTPTFQSVEAGRSVSWTFDGAGGTATGGLLAWSGGLQSFCVQLEENVSVGQAVSFEVVGPESLPDAPPMPGPMGSVRSALVQDLYSRSYESMIIMTGSALQDQAAAFQMVIWEITHELSADDTDLASLVADLDLSSGDATFASTAAVDAIAQDLIANLGFNGFRPFSRLRGLTNETYQDQLIVVPGTGALAGLAGVVLLGRRRPRP